MKNKKLITLAVAGILCTSLIQGQTIVNDVAALQSSIASAAEGDVIKLSPSFPTTLTATINATINHSKNFIVDGGGKTIIIGGNYRHFSITKTTSSGTFTLKNIELKGLRTDSDGPNTGIGGGGAAISDESKGIIAFDHVYFNSIRNGGLAFSNLDADAIVKVSNSTFRNNSTGNHGAAILYGGTGNLEVSDCTFSENNNPSYGYSGGAIACFNHCGQFRLKRSVFLNNVAIQHGGAISIYHAQGTISATSIDSCYFEGNKVTRGDGNGDGGAVSVYSAVGTQLDLRNSTFYKNYASDDGGALFIENQGAGGENYVTNCTMYGNYGNDVAPAKSSSLNIATCGGAIQLSLPSLVTIENSTIIQNYTKSIYPRGGGLGFHASLAGGPKVTLKNNIILGNYILNGAIPVYNAHSNVGLKASFAASATVAQTGNVGYDNGIILPVNVTLLNAFGNSDPVKWENYNNNKIGNPNEINVAYYRAIPTISIKLNDGTDVLGLADRKGVASSLAVDERGYLRDQTNPNIGAVEIRWVKFDANGGAWSSFPNLTYDGTVYYEKDGSGDVENCYQITYHSGSVSFPNDKPERDGHIFLNWALDNASGTKWDELPLTITVNRTLYAVWRMGLFVFGNDTICEPDKADLTNLTPESGSVAGLTLNYYMDSICTIPVSNPEAVGGGVYYITGVNALNQRDTSAVNIIENKRITLMLNQRKDTCIYQLVDNLDLVILGPAQNIIAGSEKWLLGDSVIDLHMYKLSLRDGGKMLYYQADTRCGRLRSNKIEIDVCKTEVVILRPVWIPEVPGIKTNLPSGEHFVKGHDDFVFTITLLPGYSLDGISVKTNKPLWDDHGGVILERIAENTIKVRIKQVTVPMILTITGVNPTSNTSVMSDAGIWTAGGQLFVNIEKPTELSIYTISGNLYLKKHLSEGQTVLSLPAGVYIVVLEGKSYLKAVIK